MKGELLFDVKLQKLKLAFLFLKQLKGVLECVVRRSEKMITMADQHACFIFSQNLLLHS